MCKVKGQRQSYAAAGANTLSLILHTIQVQNHLLFISHKSYQGTLIIVIQYKGLPLKEACSYLMNEELKDVQGDMGLIAVGKHGNNKNGI